MSNIHLSKWEMFTVLGVSAWVGGGGWEQGNIISYMLRYSWLSLTRSTIAFMFTRRQLVFPFMWKSIPSPAAAVSSMYNKPEKRWNAARARGGGELTQWKSYGHHDSQSCCCLRCDGMKRPICSLKYIFPIHVVRSASRPSSSSRKQSESQSGGHTKAASTNFTANYRLSGAFLPFALLSALSFRVRPVKCLKSPRRLGIFMSFHFLITTRASRRWKTFSISRHDDAWRRELFVLGTASPFALALIEWETRLSWWKAKTWFQSKLMCHKLSAFSRILRFSEMKLRGKPILRSIKWFFGIECQKRAGGGVGGSRTRRKISKFNDGKIYVKQQRIDHTEKARRDGLSFHE